MLADVKTFILQSNVEKMRIRIYILCKINYVSFI